jgi:hypothetical protein
LEHQCFLQLLLPDADVYAVDDPDDPLLHANDNEYIHWDDQELPALGPSIPNNTTAPDDDRPRAQVDDAAQVTCTNDRTLLFHYRP